MAAERNTLPHLFDTAKATFPKSLGPHGWYLVTVDIAPLHEIAVLSVEHDLLTHRFLGISPHHQLATIKLRPTLGLFNTAARVSKR